MSERKIVGLLAIIVGAAIIAPKETGIILGAIADKCKNKNSDLCNANNQIESKSTEENKNNINNEIKSESIEELGLIRKTKKSIIESANKFYKWLY